MEAGKMQEAKKAEQSLPVALWKGIPLPLTPLSLTYVQSRTCRQTFMEELLGALLWGTPQGNKSTLGTVLGETPAQSRTLRNNRR